MPGDCGAWVIDALTGSIYGHVIAGDLTSSTAYIIPAYKVFDDIEDRFGVPPLLPSEPAPRDSTAVAKTSNQPSRNFTDSKLAFFGTSGRFLDAANPEYLWEKFRELLEKGIDRRKAVPKERFNEARIDPTEQRKNICHTRPYTLFTNEPRLFDARFFGVSPEGITQTDRMQRFALATAYEALEVSGYTPNRTSSTKLHRFRTFCDQIIDDWRKPTTPYEALEVSGYIPNRTSSTKIHRFGRIQNQTSDEWREIQRRQDIEPYPISGGRRALALVDTGCSSNVVSLQFSMAFLEFGDQDTTVTAGGMKFMPPAVTVVNLSDPDTLSNLSHGKWLISDFFPPGRMEAREAIELPFRVLSFRDQLETNEPTHLLFRWNPLYHVDRAEGTTEQEHMNVDLGETMDGRVFIDSTKSRLIVRVQLLSRDSTTAAGSRGGPSRGRHESEGHDS